MNISKYILLNKISDILHNISDMTNFSKIAKSEEKKNNNNSNKILFKNKFDHIKNNHSKNLKFYADNIDYITLPYIVRVHDVHWDTEASILRKSIIYKMEDYNAIRSRIYYTIKRELYGKSIFDINDDNILQKYVKEINTMLYINERVLEFSTNCKSSSKKEEAIIFFKTLKENIDFYKKYELKNGNLWSNLDDKTFENLKKTCIDNIDTKEYYILRRNAMKYFGDKPEWDRELNDFINENWVNNNYPIDLYKLYTNIISDGNIINDDFNDYIFESLKPEIPEWLKGTSCENLINNIILEQYNDDVKKDFFNLFKEFNDIYYSKKYNYYERKDVFVKLLKTIDDKLKKYFNTKY